MQTALVIKKLQTYPMSQGLELFPVFGTLDGEFSNIEIIKGILKTKGHLTASVFQGHIDVDNVWGSDLQSSNRLIGMNIRFGNLNMGLELRNKILRK